MSTYIQDTNGGDEPAAETGDAMNSANNRVPGRIPDHHDERMVAAYEALSANADDRQRAVWAAAGIPELEARVQSSDLARENAVLKTIMQAQRIGAGWSGNATDVMHLHRALRRAGIVP